MGLDPFFWPYHAGRLDLPVEIALHIATALIAGGLLLRGRSRREQLTILTLLCAGGLGIDLDHAIVAGSFHTDDMLGLTVRPPTHSLTFVLLAGLLVARLWRPVYGWALAAGLMAHLAYDAPVGAIRFLYPWQAVQPLPSLVCAAWLLALAAISGLLTKRLR